MEKNKAGRGVVVVVVKWQTVTESGKALPKR